MVAEYPTSYRKAGVRGFSGRPDFELPRSSPGRTGFPANYPRAPRARVDVKTRIPPIARYRPRGFGALGIARAAIQAFNTPPENVYPAASDVVAPPSGYHYIGSRINNEAIMNAWGEPLGLSVPFTYLGLSIDVLAAGSQVRRRASWDWAGDSASVGTESTGNMGMTNAYPPTSLYHHYWIGKVYQPNTGSVLAIAPYLLYSKTSVGTAAPIPAGYAVPMEVPAALPMPAYAPPINFVEVVPPGQKGLGAYRRIKESQDPFLEPELAPQPAPVRPNVRPTVGVEIVVPPSGVPVLAPATAEPLRPPRDGTREKKGRTPFETGFAGWADLLGFNPKNGLDAVTEALDLLNATYYSIDEEFRPPAFTPQEKAIAIIENFDHISFDEWAKNVIAMHLQDQVLGQLSSQAMKGLRKYGFDGTFFGPLL